MHLRWEWVKLAFAHGAYRYFIWMFELHCARNDVCVSVYMPCFLVPACVLALSTLKYQYNCFTIFFCLINSSLCQNLKSYTLIFFNQKVNDIMKL